MSIKVNSANYQNNVDSLIPYLDDYETFGGMNNTELLNFHFNEKIYQFDTHVLENEFVCTLQYRDDCYQVFLQRIIPGYTITGEHPEQHPTTLSDPILVGVTNSRSNSLIKKYLEENYTCIPLLYGGRYKKVIVGKDGDDHVKSFREPFRLALEFKKPRNEPAPKLQQQTTPPIQVDKNNTGCMGCLIIVLIAIIAVPLLIFLNMIFNY